MKTIIAAVMMLASAAAYGQLYKCTSKDGKVEYADRCPEGTTVERTTIFHKGSGAAPSPAPPPKSLVERDADFRKRQMEQQEAQQKAERKSAESEQRQRACEDARAYLASLKAGMRITRTDPKTGERVYLEDSEYAGEIAKAEQRVAQNCK